MEGEGCKASSPQPFPDEVKARLVFAQEIFKKGRRSVVLSSRAHGASAVEIERHDQEAS